jgi:hypothetical protein
MMTGAYFVGRKELLAWVNDLLQTQYKKVRSQSWGGNEEDKKVTPACLYRWKSCAVEPRIVKSLMPCFLAK